jgi:hypothetical protein
LNAWEFLLVRCLFTRVDVDDAIRKHASIRAGRTEQRIEQGTIVNIPAVQLKTVPIGPFQRSKSSVSIWVVPIAFSLLLCGCAPPQFIYAYYAAMLAVPLYGLGFALLLLVLALARGPARKTECVYLVALWLLYLIPLVSEISQILAGVALNGDEALLAQALGFGSPYISALGEAVLSALIIGATVRIIRRWDTALPGSLKAMMFGFLLFFVLNFGYYFTMSEWWSSDQAVSETIRSFEGNQAFESHVMIFGQLPYLGFLLAPIIVASAWAFHFLRTKRHWRPSHLLRLNLEALWIILIILIGVGVIVKARDASSQNLDSSQIAMLTKTNYQEVYLFLSDRRYIIFLSVCHDLLIILLLTLGVILIQGEAELYRLRNHLILGGVLLIVLLATLPYYVGQQALVEQIVNAFGGTYAARLDLHEELLRTRPLYPTSIDFKQLVSALSIGGAVVLMFNLPGLHLQLGTGSSSDG